MSDESAVLDTNILVFALFTDSAHHRAARALLESATEPTARLCVTAQVLAEFFSIVTNAKRVSLPHTPPEALEALRAITRLPGIKVLPTPPDVHTRWLALLKDHPVARARVFDLLLAATMLANDVRYIYTFNAADFEPLTDLRVHTPPNPA